MDSKGKAKPATFSIDQRLHPMHLWTTAESNKDELFRPEEGSGETAGQKESKGP